MKTARALTCSFIGLCLVLCPASAAGNPRVQKILDALLNDRVALLAKFPPLAGIDDVLRADCTAKNPGKVSNGAFCICASALTMNVWFSGADPKMIPRINDYLRRPVDNGAKTFLKYQGPELYAGACEELLKP